VIESPTFANTRSSVLAHRRVGTGIVRRGVAVGRRAIRRHCHPVDGSIDRLRAVAAAAEREREQDRDDRRHDAHDERQPRALHRGVPDRMVRRREAILERVERLLEQAPRERRERECDGDLDGQDP
jgi:hypothetical protein